MGGGQPAHKLASAHQADFTALANFTGLPATAFPVGTTTEGLPLSCQVVAMTETTTLGLAERLAVPGGTPADYRGVGCTWTGCPVAALPAHASAAGRVHHDGHRLAARQRLPTRRDGRGDSSGHQLRGDL